MKNISKNPEIIDEMKNNMENNTNDKAMEKLYEIAMEYLKN